MTASTATSASSITAATSITLTLEEKRARFFNVGEPFEVSAKEFDEELWPLVSNIWVQYVAKNPVKGQWIAYSCRLSKLKKSSIRKVDVPDNKRRKTGILAGHCLAKIRVTRLDAIKRVKIERYNGSPDHDHPIQTCDERKLPNVIKNLVVEEARKRYAPSAIVDAVRELAANNGLSEVAHHLQRIDVANIQLKYRGAQNAHLIGEDDLGKDMDCTLKFLTSKGYRVEQFSVARRSSQGFCFANPHQLEKLARHGWLTLIDSTHNTNKHLWRLFTLYIRDSYGCWDVGSHFFVSGEDGDTVAEALRTIRRFASRWEPRYMLADQSSVEANSIMKAFPGIKCGEQNCDVLLCTVHVMRTWMAKIYHPATRNKMILAMHKRTRIGCEDIVRRAIAACPVQDIQRYINRNYLKNTHRWSLWARQHSPLLLQVTSTNALESYHSQLKRGTSKVHGLIGACHIIINVDDKKKSASEKTAFNFRQKRLSVADMGDDILHQVHCFPYPFQRLIADEFRALEGRISKGKPPPELATPECNCLFFNRYLLPCRHIFHQHLYSDNKLLTDDVWRAFQWMFAEAGFEIYEHRERIELNMPAQTQAQRLTEQRRQALNEIWERVRDRFWREEERGNGERVDMFIARITASVGPILDNE